MFNNMFEKNSEVSRPTILHFTFFIYKVTPFLKMAISR